MSKACPLPYLDVLVPNRENAYPIIKARLDEFYDWALFVDDPTKIRELHNFRIAAKRLRYSFEVFEDVLPVQATALRAEVEQIQEELGAVHDSDVMSIMLRLCLTTTYPAGPDATAVLQEMHQYNLELPKELMATLLDSHTLPTSEEQQGLQLLLDEVVRERKTQYAQFHRHWSQLKAQDYRQMVLALFE